MIDKRLEPCQQQAIQSVIKKNKVDFQSNKQDFIQRTNQLGISLNRIRHYLCFNTQLIMFIPIDRPRTLELLLNTTHYHNQFEIGRSCGTLNFKDRELWESVLFSHKYDVSEPSQRVKYGYFNIFKQVQHTFLQNNYGPHYFILKPLHHRITITNADSGFAIGNRERCYPCTTDYNYHLLAACSDEKLLLLDKLASGESVTESEMANYTKNIHDVLEFQIHGPVSFKHDVAALVIVLPVDEQVIESARKFAKKHNIAIRFKKKWH